MLSIFSRLGGGGEQDQLQIQNFRRILSIFETVFGFE
jgi:hypothetical protein